MNKVLNKKIELNKSDKIKISVIISFVVGVASMIIYNAVVIGANSSI